MQEAIGVWSLASDALDSGLLKLLASADRPAPDVSAELRRLSELTDASFGTFAP